MVSLGQHIELLHASTDRPNLVDVPERRVLALDGVGDRAGPGFRKACEALVAGAEAIAAMRPRRVEGAVPVGHLEALWWKDGTTSWIEASASDEPWHWEAMIECPSDVADEESVAALRRAAARPVALEDLQRIRVVRLVEGRSVQILHLGRFEDEGVVLRRLLGEIAALGLAVAGRHHEIYMTDPRRPVAEPARTIIRYPVAKARP